MIEIGFNDFRDLEVWRGCRAIRERIWELCRKLPGEEKYRLVDQMVRASRSVTACIAEKDTAGANTRQICNSAGKPQVPFIS